MGTARIYAPQARLRATVGRPALAVTCGARCGIEARPRVAGRSLGRQRQTVPAGEVGVLRLSRATARRLKGATAARVRFPLRIRVDGWAARRVTVALRTRAAR